LSRKHVSSLFLAPLPASLFLFLVLFLSRKRIFSREGNETRSRKLVRGNSFSEGGKRGSSLFLPLSLSRFLFLSLSRFQKESRFLAALCPFLARALSLVASDYSLLHVHSFREHRVSRETLCASRDSVRVKAGDLGVWGCTLVDILSQSGL